jgi:ribosomal protein S18 acetylase RimI-like enzyme
MNILFRPAEPSDVDAAISLIYSSGPQAFNFVFTCPGQGNAQDFLRHAFVHGAGEFGYRNHIVGVEDGKVVAVGGAWSGKSGLSFMLAAAQQILRHYGWLAGVRVIVRGLRTEAVIPPPPRNRLYIGHLGVLPARQSCGIGRLLIEHLIALRKADGFTVAALDVAVTNQRGQALYERLGFAVTVERHSTLSNAHGTVANHRRMEMKIV